MEVGCRIGPLLLVVHTNCVPDLMHHVADVPIAVAPAQVDFSVVIRSGISQSCDVATGGAVDPDLEVRCLSSLLSCLDQGYASPGLHPLHCSAEGFFPSVIDICIEEVVDPYPILPAPWHALKSFGPTIDPGTARSTTRRKARPQKVFRVLVLLQQTSFVGHRAWTVAVFSLLIFAPTANDNRIKIGHIELCEGVLVLNRDARCLKEALVEGDLETRSRLARQDLLLRERQARTRR
mmetsp:Transcript_39741/g.84836  ORF Transcript_39741/g.84836 Transcript_39741/m.84836 type:complete len:236 (+) Transcript_39741:1073-1780(+)